MKTKGKAISKLCSLIISITIVLSVLGNVSNVLAISPSVQASVSSQAFSPKINDYAWALPFNSGGRTMYFQGPHTTGIAGNVNADTTRSGMDLIASDKKAFDVVASAPGTLSFRGICKIKPKNGTNYDYLAMIYIRHPDIYPSDKVTGGIATGYVHVKINLTQYGLKSSDLGTYTKWLSKTYSVTKGQKLGTSIKPDDYPSNYCGSGNVNHLHFFIMKWEKGTTTTYTDWPINDANIGGWQIKNSAWINSKWVDKGVYTGTIIKIKDGSKKVDSTLNGLGGMISDLGLVGNGKCPSAPNLISPMNNANLYDPNVNFSWSKLISQYFNPIEYFLEYSGTLSGNSGWISGTNYFANLPVGTYTWRVKARNLNCESQWITSQNITILPASPVAPILNLPVDKSLVESNTLLNWNASDRAVEYYLEYTDGTISGNSGWISDTSFTVNSLTLGTYTWHVKARNAGGESPWSESWTFTVQPATPPAPTLASPFDNTTTTPDVVFTWNASAGATEYYLEYTDGATSGNSGWITPTSFTASSLAVGDYTWWVKARNSAGESFPSQTWHFTVQSPIVLPDPPTLVSPLDTSNTSSDITLTWNSVSNATEYYVGYSGPSTGNSGWIAGTSFAVASLPVGTYSWHVKAQNADGESSWSASWTFTVLPPAPVAPTLMSPTDASTHNQDVTFSWNSVADATEYYLDYSGPVSGNSGWGTSTNFQVTALPGGDYTWWVKSRNAGGESSPSASWTFTVQPSVVAPVAPILLSPANGGTTGADFTFTWNSMDNAADYYAEYSGASNGNSGWISVPSFNVTTLPVGSYSWRVKARNPAGEGPWSDLWSFTVLPAAPPAPTLVLPNDNANIVNTSLTFNWNASVGATEYYLEYLGPANGNSGWIAATTYQVSSLPAGTYTWKVKARNAGGESAWSLTRTVNYQAPPAQIVITTPTTLYPTFSTTNCPTSNWMRSTNTLGHYYYFTQNNNVNPWAANPNYGYWKGTLPVAGYYKIEFYVPSHGTFYWCGTGGKAISTNTNDAHYQIYTSGSTWTKVEKSQSGGNVWISLGNFYLTAGNYNIVKLIDSNHQTSYSQLILFSEIRITWVSQ